MNWYAGEIREAVAFSQSKQAVFFVAIFGPDEQSKELEAVLNTPEVQRVVSSDSFVCIRLGADSEQHRLFADIYANAKSPSIYCITEKGVPVEIITAPLPTSELKERLESALNRHRQVLGLKPSGSAIVSPAASTTQVQPTNPPSAVANEVNNETNAEPDNTRDSTSSDDNNSQLPFEERVRRAKELAAARQLQKQKEEEEESKRREIDRRQAGKGAAELKRWQDEQEAKKLQEERRKDREEEKALRQRLREQIAQDRVARNARTNVELVEQSTPSASKPSITTSSPVNFAGQARLQFRLPDGSSQTHAFPPDSTLGHVRQYLRDNNAIPFREFSIWVAFPRRQFSETDFGTSLRDLGLLPSAALLILPLSGLSMNPEAARNSGLWALLATLFGFVIYPITLMWSMFQRALPSSAPSDKPQTSTSNTHPDGEDKRLNAMGRGKALGGGSNNKDQSTTSSGSAPNNDNPNPAKKKSKEKGNSQPSDGIHRLRTTESDSDEEKFYNGNSTQQM